MHACTVAGWVKILQYADKYTPTAKAVGDLSKSTADGGFAKLSDAAINAIPADNNGYFYFKLEDTGDDHQPTLLIRTKIPFNDTASGFGWQTQTTKFEVCNTSDIFSCLWEKTSGFNFDTQHAYKDDCNRWFADKYKTVYCYGVGAGQRCFNKGLATCNRALRDHVTMYKWSFDQTTTTARPSTTGSKGVYSSILVCNHPLLARSLVVFTLIHKSLTPIPIPLPYLTFPLEYTMF